jgi:soluble lytic murein transglycosylase-like protein
MHDDGSGGWRAGEHVDGLGIRGEGQRRHHDERRKRHRLGRGRRRRDRRRASVRTLLLTAAALSAPHAVRVGARPTVQVAINSFDAVEARYAYDDIVEEAARTYDLDPRMIKAVMQTESAFDATAVSPVGALGLMQLMPAVATELGVADPLDPRQNIMAGAKYLRRLLDSHNGNVSLALASYNAGPGNVAKYRAIPPFKETRDYVKRVTALLDSGD